MFAANGEVFLERIHKYMKIVRNDSLCQQQIQDRKLMSRSYLNQKHYTLSFQINHTFSPDGAAQASLNKMTFITGTLNRGA